MSGPATAREALIAEVIGDLARLLDRADEVQASLTESRQALVDAQAQLASRLAIFEAQVTALTDQVKVQAVKHIVLRADEAARRSVDAQTRAIGECAQALFRSELERAIQRLASQLAQVVKGVRRPWVLWLTHAAAALAGSALTLGLAWIMAR